MLTEKRQEEILRLLTVKGSVTVQELKEQLHASESTIRRDLNQMHQEGVLGKVFGGAGTAEKRVSAKDEQVAFREERNQAEKIKIGQYAAGLIGENDFVYLDAGTTTGYMIPFIKEKTATFVTNAVSHGMRLAQNGFRVILIGGELKLSTEAIVGNEAYVNLQKYHFTIGFWGTNGVGREAGFSTPDINEAMIKQCAMKRTQKRYVLCDHEKFLHTSAVTFGEFEEATVITDKVLDSSYRHCVNIVELSD